MNGVAMSRRFVPALLAAACLAGCSHAGSITRLSADYNKAMADVRNEQLLLNILRAAAREPLQFSAMGEVAATVDRTAGIDTTIENLIAGGANAISHSVGLSGGNKPVIKVTPLSNKDFISGMMRQTSPETLKLFMELGWDAEFLLPLVVASYKCPGEAVQRNSGEGSAGDSVRERLAAAAAGMELEKAVTPGEEITLRVTDDQALEMMRSGIAGGYKLLSVKPAGRAGMSAVRLGSPAKSEWLVRNFRLCTGTRGVEGAQLAFVEDGKALADDRGGDSAFLKLRSVEGIIYFLGERLRDCYLKGRPVEECALPYAKGAERRFLFRVSSAGGKPDPVLVGTRFYGRDFWVSRLDSGDVDRTAKTLSFLNQLIALQTDASEVATTPTVLSIGGR